MILSQTSLVNFSKSYLPSTTVKSAINFIPFDLKSQRSLFDKRKLRLELKSLTSGSKLVVFVLIGIPFFFVFVVSLINPDYLDERLTEDGKRHPEKVLYITKIKPNLKYQEAFKKALENE